MNSKGEVISVRQQLAEFTQSVHLELHEHPWISQLALPQISEAHYYLIMSAYRQFYSTVERQRQQLSVFDELSLTPAVKALDIDCAHLSSEISSISNNALKLLTPTEILGSLYVLHGARFGAKLMQRNITQNLPHASQHFLSLNTSHRVWRLLIHHLEQQSSPKAMFNAAKQTFIHFGEFVTNVCESTPMKNYQPQLP